MYAWLASFDVSLSTVLWTVGLTVVGVAASVAISVFVLVRLPPDFFQRPANERFFRNMRPPWRQLALVGKNLLGVAIVVVGVALSVPGVPGQGVLTILLGLMLLDFPGRARLELAILHLPAVRKGVDRVRIRFGKARLDLPQR